jgi:hypothetical protein
MNTILCPHCGKEVEISSALSHQMEQEILAREKTKHLKELEDVKQKALDESKKKIEEQFALQLKQQKEDNEAKDLRNKELIEQITEMTKDLREMRREKDEVKLQMEKQLAVEEEKIRLDAQKKAEEEQHSKITQKDKQLSDALKELEDMRRKLQQGSQQTQGEAFELEFEALLKSHYPNDKITPVEKGVKGADLIQEVWDRNGVYAGKILWELKNTKTWSEPWIAKLKDDKRSINAEEAIIITQTMPSNMQYAGFRNGIWVTERRYILPLADSLRVKLIELIIIKNSLKGKDIKMESLYNYLTGTEFKNRLEAIVEAFGNMQQEIEKEKRYFANKWARDEKNIRQVIDSTYGMHGDFKGILSSAVPQIAGIDGALELDTTDSQQKLLE